MVTTNRSILSCISRTRGGRGNCRQKGGFVTNEMIDVIVIALKKQIPQKPTDPDDDYGTFKYPACGGLIYTEDCFETHKFCIYADRR